MKIIIPVGPKDADNLAWLVRAILIHGRVRQRILIVSVPSQVENALKAQKALQAVCEDVEVIDTENEFADGWFMGPNRMFHWTVTYLHQNGNAEPWLWMEPDCCPMTPRWADRLEEDYRQAKKPYYGFVRPTRHKDSQGRIFFTPGDNMLLGVAIYPHNMLNDSEIVPLFNSLSIDAKSAHPEEPWDLWLRWKFFKRGVHTSNLIFDKWRTINYRRDGKDLICDADPDSPTKTAEGGIISPLAVLIHGCKDTSLQKLVTGENTLPVEDVIEAQTGEGIKIVNAIKDMMAVGDKLRVGNIAARAGMSTADAKPLIEQLGHTIGKAGWVTLKEEPQL